MRYALSRLFARFTFYFEQSSVRDPDPPPSDVRAERAVVRGNQTTPKNQIVTDKLRRLGMLFGGRPLLRRTVEQLVDTT